MSLDFLYLVSFLLIVKVTQGLTVLIITVSVGHRDTTSLFYFSYVRAKIKWWKKGVFGECVASCLSVLWEAIYATLYCLKMLLCNWHLLVWFALSEQANTGNQKNFEESSVQKSSKLALTYIFFLTWIFAFFPDINSLPSKVTGFRLLFVGVENRCEDPDTTWYISFNKAWKRNKILPMRELGL